MDNIKTAVDEIFSGKTRQYNRRFLQMCSGNHPIFKRPDFWASRGKFQFHGGGAAADAHVRALIVVTP